MSSPAAHEGADVAVVNTCGFLDSAQAESLAAIGKALARERQGDRHRLHGRGAREDHRALPGRARGHRPAAIRERGRGRASRGAAAARSVSRSGAAGGHQAHAAALRLSEDFRGLQQSLQLLHHPEAARRPRLAARRRRAARGRAPGGRRREGTSGHLAGHLGLWGRPQIRGERMEGPRGAGKISRSGARARRARCLGAAALRLSLPARGRGHRVDGRGQGAALSRHPVPARGARRAPAHEAAGRAGKDAGADRALARNLSRPHHPLDVHRRLSRRERRGFSVPAGLARAGASSIASAASATSR